MRRLTIFLTLLLVTACGTRSSPPRTEIVRFYITATPRSTATPSATPSPTLTPTPTPTQTPTAQPAAISGNPRGFQMLDPTPVYGAPCGLVDTFDFPLDPPDGEDAAGRFGFGSYSSRYEKYHAGEDWGFPNATNLGKPVYSIGHGQVTYAAPNGWGLDRGTVVIRHILPRGGYLLSFYGHLDPPSVSIRAGECVERGDKIGEIGKPRTSPHLHFEIRLHLPNSAGHGYWSTDPALAGWLPPSQTILETRLGASPGVLWTRTFTNGFTRGLGSLDENTILIQGGEMSAVDPLEGTIRWSQPISDTIRNAVLDPISVQVYQLDLMGDLTAYSLPGPSEPIWKVGLNAFNSAELIPLPRGGVLIADRRQAVAVSPEGEISWQQETFAAPISWVRHADQLIFSTSDPENPVWTADSDGISAWDLQFGGKLGVSSGDVYLYGEDGLYRLDVLRQTASLVKQLPAGYRNLADLTSYPGGGVLLIHTDDYDRRLIVVRPDGSLVWERSIKTLPQGDFRLLTQGETIFLMNSYSGSTGMELDLYAIQAGSSDLIRIFHGGSRQSFLRNTWLIPMNTDQLLVNIGGGPMGAFNPQIALGIMSSP